MVGFRGDVIVALCGLNQQLEPLRFLGTGSFIADGAVLLTADHVIRDWRGPYGAFIKTTQELLPMEVLDRDPQHDLALLRTTSEHHPPEVLKLPKDLEPQRYFNVPVVTFEYGTTEIRGERIYLNPATRMGNITRDFHTLEPLGPAGDGAFELSFPALRGASGAPVIYQHPNVAETIVGVIVANHSYHLLPVQIESVLNVDNSLLEETRFMLPQGIAVSIRHLKQMYDRHLA